MCDVCRFSVPRSKSGTQCRFSWSLATGQIHLYALEWCKHTHTHTHFYSLIAIANGWRLLLSFTQASSTAGSLRSRYTSSAWEMDRPISIRMLMNTFKCSAVRCFLFIWGALRDFICDEMRCWTTFWPRYVRLLVPFFEISYLKATHKYECHLIWKMTFDWEKKSEHCQISHQIDWNKEIETINSNVLISDKTIKFIQKSCDLVGSFPMFEKVTTKNCHLKKWHVMLKLIHAYELFAEKVNNFY